MYRLIGSVLVQHETQNKREILLTVVENHGDIFVNGMKLDSGFNVEGSIRLFGNVRSEFNLFTTYFHSTPEKSGRNFLHSWWEDLAIANILVAATVIVTKMDYDSGYDSIG